eukprot:1700114-Prymnesium_polylepis.2
MAQSARSTTRPPSTCRGGRPTPRTSSRPSRCATFSRSPARSEAGSRARRTRRRHAWTPTRRPTTWRARSRSSRRPTCRARRAPSTPVIVRRNSSPRAGWTLLPPRLEPRPSCGTCRAAADDLVSCLRGGRQLDPPSARRRDRGRRNGPRHPGRAAQVPLHAVRYERVVVRAAEPEGTAARGFQPQGRAPAFHRAAALSAGAPMHH